MPNNTGAELVQSHFRDDRINESKRIIEAAKEKGIILRLVGGLAVRNHCVQINFCERDYVGIDFIGLNHQPNEIKMLFKELGYSKILNVVVATSFG